MYGIPEELIALVKAMFNNFECAVLDEGGTTEWFQVQSGVKQGCVMSSFLFLLAIDWVMSRTTEGRGTGIRWKFTSVLEDLDFADDIALLSSRSEQNRTSDEIRRRRWNWTGHIMRKGREEHCVTALEWRPEGRRRPGRPKTTWRRMVEDERQTAGWQSWANVRALAAIVVGGKRMSKPYVPYGMERYRYR
ncbi:hypothetical protein ACROYT_G029324 [Oculina patagonica]